MLRKRELKRNDEVGESNPSATPVATEDDPFDDGARRSSPFNTTTEVAPMPPIPEVEDDTPGIEDDSSWSRYDA